MPLRDFPAFYFQRSLICCQNKTIQNVWIQPVQWQRVWPPSGASTGRHRGHGISCVWDPGSQPNWAERQPRYWRYGEGHAYVIVRSLQSTETMKGVFFFFVNVDMLFNSLQRATLYWIQTLTFSRRWDIFAKSVKLLVQTNNLWSQGAHSACLQVTPTH